MLTLRRVATGLPWLNNIVLVGLASFIASIPDEFPDVRRIPCYNWTCDGVGLAYASTLHCSI